jgi:hypothetical protein
MRTSVTSNSPLNLPSVFRARYEWGVHRHFWNRRDRADGHTVGIGDVYMQTKRCIEIARQALVETGASLKEVIRTRILLTDINTWREAARAHGEAFSDIRPATTFMQVSLHRSRVVSGNRDGCIE